MLAAIDQYPHFETGSSSEQYQQISNYCVNRLEGLLISLMHMDISDQLEKDQQSYKLLQKKLLSRERTVKHALQFQIEKRFSGFKSVRKSRLRTSRSSDWQKLGLAGHSSSRVQDIIENISIKSHNHHESRLSVLDRRMKMLVHRSDGALVDNPISPLSLCEAFLSSIEALNLSGSKTRQLFELFDNILDQHLGNLYIQIDLGMYHLGLLPDLTDSAIFIPAEQANVGSAKEQTIASEISDEKPPIEYEDDEAFIRSINRALKSRQKLLIIDKNNRLAEQELQKFRRATENGSLNYASLLTQFKTGIEPFISERQNGDIGKFSVFYTGLLDNPLLASPLKKQLSRLSYPLVELLFVDPFFFRSSSHPVNNFLHCIIDFEIRYTHHQSSLAFLADLIKSILSLDKPVASDFQPTITAYKTYTQQKIESLNRARDQQIAQELAREQQEALELAKRQQKALELAREQQLALDRAREKQIALDLAREQQIALELARKQQIARELAQEQRQAADKKCQQEILQRVNDITEKLSIKLDTLSFFYDDWQFLLLQVARKIGIDSDEFKQSIEIAKMLAWSLEKKKTGHPEYRKYSFTSLIRAIDKGLGSLNFSSEHRHRVRKLLIDEFKQKNSKTSYTVKPSASSNSFQIFDDFSIMVISNVTPLTRNKTTKPKGKSGEQDATSDSLMMGAWVEINSDKTGKFKRAKLKWKAVDNSLFMFIDQRGHKILECDQQNLNEKLSSGSVKLLNNPSPFGQSGQTLGSGFDCHISN